MFKIFYCACCNTLKSNFKISEQELRLRQTWLNPRDGYGSMITHLVCPSCGYVLSGFMRFNMEFNNIANLKSLEDYTRYTIEGYSAKDACYLKEGGADFIANDQIEML